MKLRPLLAAVAAATAAGDAVYSIGDLVKSGYSTDDLTKIPTVSSSLPVDVKVVLTNFFNLDQVEGTYQIQGTTMYVWEDPRLQMPNDGTTRVQLQTTDVWKPVQDYYNAVSLKVEASKLAYLNWTGYEAYAPYSYTGATLVYTERFVATISMRLNFQTYPFDKHSLPLELELFGNPAEFVSHRNVLVVLGDLTDPAWNIVSGTAAASNVTKSTGRKYSRMTIHLHVSRQWVNKAITLYSPFLFIFILNYGSYYMALDQLPARTALTILSMLSAFTYYNAVSASLPPRGYFTFLDVYAVLCILATGFGVLVFLRVHHLMRVEKKTGVAEPPSENDWFRAFNGYATAPPSERLDIIMRNVHPWLFAATFILILWPMSYEWYLTPYITDDFA